jgi:hypothetical protein
MLLVALIETDAAGTVLYSLLYCCRTVALVYCY